MEDLREKHKATIAFVQEVDQATSVIIDTLDSGWSWQIHPMRSWGMATAVHPDLMPHICDSRHGKFWMATTFTLTQKSTSYNVHLPTSWAPDELWIDQLRELEKDIRQQENKHGENKVYIGGDWNIDVTMMDSTEGNARHEFLRQFLDEWGLAAITPSTWSGAA